MLQLKVSRYVFVTQPRRQVGSSQLDRKRTVSNQYLQQQTPSSWSWGGYRPRHAKDRWRGRKVCTCPFLGINKNCIFVYVGLSLSIIQDITGTVCRVIVRKAVLPLGLWYFSIFKFEWLCTWKQSLTGTHGYPRKCTLWRFPGIHFAGESLWYDPNIIIFQERIDKYAEDILAMEPFEDAFLDRCVIIFSFSGCDLHFKNHTGCQGWKGAKKMLFLN